MAVDERISGIHKKEKRAVKGICRIFERRRSTLFVYSRFCWCMRVGMSVDIVVNVVILVMVVVVVVVVMIMMVVVLVLVLVVRLLDMAAGAHIFPSSFQISSSFVNEDHDNDNDVDY